MNWTTARCWHARRLAVTAATLLALSSAASADEIRVITSGAFTAAFTELKPEFERTTKHTVVTTYGGSLGNAPDSIPSRLARGEPADIVIMAREGLDILVKEGKVVAGSEIDLVRSKMAIAIRAGAPKPDVSSLEAFKRTMLAARSIAYSTSASGVYLGDELFPRLGIAAALAPRTTRVGSGPVGEVIARGDAEIGFQQYSELLPIRGIDIVTALPTEVQRVTLFSAGTTTTAKAPGAARALIAFLRSAAAAPAITRSGLEPIAAVSSDTAPQNRIDVVAPLAPELASYGTFEVGVRTVQVTDHKRPDILNTREGSEPPLYDRTLTLEIWYPAALAPGQKPGGEYRAITRDPAITATLHGKAVRDAAPAGASGGFPLVIISHGYPGNRYLLSHLAENLASKGFVSVSIDHKDSTYDDQKAFASTLYNRPFDQLFVLDEIARQAASGSGSFLNGLVDVNRTGIVGYSMGGYGVVNVVGGGYSKASETFQGAPPNHLLARRGAANPDYRKAVDPRIKAAIAIAPWGMQVGFWDADGLRGITTPLMVVAGSVDDVAGYEKGARAVYLGAVNADRYMLTFVNANHNAAAPMPAPVESYTYSETIKSFPFAHYADAVWDTTRMNNILQHFATAYFGLHLRGEEDKRAYLDVAPNTPWKGFKPRTAVGLSLEHAIPASR